MQDDRVRRNRDGAVLRGRRQQIFPGGQASLQFTSEQAGGVIQPFAQMLGLERAVLLEQSPSQPPQRGQRNAGDQDEQRHQLHRRRELLAGDHRHTWGEPSLFYAWLSGFNPWRVTALSRPSTPISHPWPPAGNSR